MPDGRILIAPDDGPLVASPTWVRIDDTDNLVANIEIDRGRQSEQEQTDTGTMTVQLNDTTGLFDPANTLSSWFGKLDGRQILCQVYDPTTSTWESQFRGLIDYATFDVNPATGPDGKPIVANVQLECVDIFDYLAGLQMVAAIDPATSNPYFGDAISDGVIVYAQTAGNIDDRMIQALTEAGIDPSMYVVFTMNVSGAEAKYDPGDTTLQVLRDCADAELPMIANIYVDRQGRFCAHGRYARFDPDDVAAGASAGAWDFTRWKAGDGAAIALDSERAQIRVLSFSRGRRDVVNAACAWPQGLAQSEVPDNTYVDSTSWDTFGAHPLPPLENLLIAAGTTTGNTAKAECALYAELYVKNMKDPLEVIRTLTVKAIRPDDARAAATWPLLTKADISDIVNLSVGYSGTDGVGIQDTDYYIEGVHKQIVPLNPTHDYVEVTYDVSPAVWSQDTSGVFPQYAAAASPPPPADVGTSTVYWGARIDGQFYTDKDYTPPFSSDAPWSGNITGGGWDLFEDHAGKRVTAIHWGGPGTALPSSFDVTANQRCRDRGAFSAYSVAASTSEMNDLASNTDARGVLTKVDTWATQVAGTHYPILVRFAWEMNGNWGYPWQTDQGISAATYVSAFQTWADRVRAIASNVSIAWCPNVADGVTDPTDWDPGATYYDWAFCDGYCHSTYETPSTIFDATMTILRGLAPDLPLGIWETGCEAPTGSPGKAAYIAAFFTWLAANTDVKAFFWFNEYGNPALPHIEVGDSATTLGGAAQTAFASGIADDRYAANIVTSTTFPSDALVPVPS